MTSLTLDHHNRGALAASLTSDSWLIACLCAAWCDVCGSYRAAFEEWSNQHPDKVFVWIDIEDQADLVGDIDVDNFPTLLMQRGDLVAFIGTVLPDTRLADRLLSAQVEKNAAELQLHVQRNSEHQQWQQHCNLWQRLRALA